MLFRFFFEISTFMLSTEFVQHEKCVAIIPITPKKLCGNDFYKTNHSKSDCYYRHPPLGWCELRRLKRAPMIKDFFNFSNLTYY